jgi:phosphopantothenoylcysteine synthetase/decarboxylase
MKLLITAGNTLVPIDRVRCITNIFTGRTGTQIALHGYERGHTVELLTSHPEVVAQFCDPAHLSAEQWRVHPYRTFADLQQLMETALQGGYFDACIHCAAVSDYASAGIYAPAEHTQFDPPCATWQSTTAHPPTLVDRAAGKVKSDEPELWLRLVRCPKLIDQIRSPWGFCGILVKFKLEVGVSEETLRDIAERSRRQSDADLMVANTLEGANAWALLGPLGGGYERVERSQLASRLLDAVEQLHRERAHG